MVESSPFDGNRLVTLENWLQPPFNRWAFQHVRELIPTACISRGEGPVWELPRAEPNLDLDGIRFAASTGQASVGELLDQTYTDGFLVLHRDEIVAERYFNTMGSDTRHLLMSVSKSIVGLVAGALVDKGQLDVAASVETIVPELGGTSFEGATVQHLLDMRAGIRFAEDYDDPESEISVCDRVYLWRPDDGKPRPADAIEYFSTLTNDGPHGDSFRYRTIVTDVLALVLERASQCRFSDLVARELWQPMGAERDAEVTVDGRGNALADAGISATLRDAGRVGLLALRRGWARDKQVIPETWLNDTIKGAADGPKVFAMAESATEYPLGAHYRNCWWVTDPQIPMFSASGVNGQAIFVHVASQTVVVKLSSWPEELNTSRRRDTVAAVHAIAKALEKRGPDA